jgi:hypothetical protein
VGGVLGKEFAVNTALLIERILEDYHDECLQILNEEEIGEKELRSVGFFFLIWNRKSVRSGMGIISSCRIWGLRGSSLTRKCINMRRWRSKGF